MGTVEKAGKVYCLYKKLEKLDEDIDFEEFDLACDGGHDQTQLRKLTDKREKIITKLDAFLK